MPRLIYPSIVAVAYMAGCSASTPLASHDEKTNMSFDILFATCNLSDKTGETFNRFTGEMTRTPVGESATREERMAIESLLADGGCTAADEDGCYSVQLAGNCSAEFFFEGLTGEEDFSSGMVALRGLTSEVTELLFRVASRGNMAMIPAMEGGKTILISDDQVNRVKSRWPDATVVYDAPALHAILEKGFNAAEAYRDQVLESHND